jgi:hypothetical protein
MLAFLKLAIGFIQALMQGAMKVADFLHWFRA